MLKRHIMRVLLLAVLTVGVGARAVEKKPSWCFSEMGNDRILLMNNDSNALCPVSSQSYYDTNTTLNTYWTHDGDPAPTIEVADLNLKDGTTHILWQRIAAKTNLGGETTVSSNMLWKLVKCRAGSAAPPKTSSSRTYIPWTTTSKSIEDGTTAMTSLKYTQAGMISLMNTTAASITSPFYTNGVGAIYFDCVNGWAAIDGTLCVEIATNTTDGTVFTQRSENLDWKLLKVDVLTVIRSGRSASAKVVETGVETILLDWSKYNSRANSGALIFRVRSSVNCRVPMRFRIRRTSSESGYLEDSTTYLIVDNIQASYLPMDITFVMKGKGLDQSREGKRVLGWQGALEQPFAFADQTGVVPWARYVTEPLETGFSPGVNNFQVSDITCHYRWTYLGIQTKAWKQLSMQAVKMVDDAMEVHAQTGSIDLSDGAGDIEFYYSAQIDSAPHYWPTDFAYGSLVSNTIKINGVSYYAPYGSDWEEGGDPWVTTSRRTDDEALPSGGTDWFVRVREGYTDYEDVAVVAHYQDGAAESVSNIWMELVGEHTWRAYYHMPTNLIGKTVKFHFAGYNKQTSGSDAFAINTNEWRFSAEAFNYLPYTGVADGPYAADVTLDALSTHLLFEFDESTGGFAVSHAAYQDFNLWTDAAKGFMGYYSTTSGVSEAKQTFVEDLSAWPVSTSANALWHEDFDVTGVISTNSPYCPNVPFTQDTTTPHGWTANNGQFICTSYTNTEEGLQLQLEGCGRGKVRIDNLAEDDIPNGIGAVDFDARVAQVPDFNGFAWSEVGLVETNYAFSAKVELSTMRAADMAGSGASVSLVGYYRPSTGCYEARAERVAPMTIELSLWKWEQNGLSLTSRKLASKTMGYPGADLTTDHMLCRTDSDYNYKEWHSMVISMCNNGSSTYVEARLARYRSGFDFRFDRPQAEGGKYNSQSYLVVGFEDTDSNHLTRGSYGIGTVNCVGYTGYPQLHAPVTNKNQYAVLNGTLITDEFADSRWILPPGRYRQLTKSNEYGKNELAGFTWSANGSRTYQYGWECGLVALVPEQDIVVNIAEAGAAQSSWTEMARFTVTNFLATHYTAYPQVAYDSYVQFMTGGDGYDTRIDVALDNIDLTCWRAGDYPDIGENYGQKDSWVYTGCWIENAVGVEDSYTVQQVPGTNEYCYVFNNAGRTVSFTPREDIYLSAALVVGGGGAGGWGAGGGGGGGGVYEITNGTVLKAGIPVSITVGAGGYNYYNAGTAATYIQRGDCGGASILTIDGEDYVAYGGGGGGSHSYPTGYGNNNYGTTLATGGGQSGNASSSPTAAGTAKGATSNRKIAYGKGGGGDSGNCCLYGGAGGGGGAGGNGHNGTTNNFEVMNSTHNLFDLIAGDGGIGYASSITGTKEYYGGGGGGGDAFLYLNTNAKNSQFLVDGHQYYGYYGTGSTWAGKYWMVRNSNAATKDYGNRTHSQGGLGGGGAGAICCQASPATGEDGEDGRGGGGGGGCSGYSGTYRPGGNGGDGTVILRIRGLGKNQCVVQPARVDSDTPAGVRSPYLANGLSMVNFSYVGANSNAVLLLQIATNVTPWDVYDATMTDSAYWTTLTNFTFESADQASGTLAYYLNLRAPAHGLVRLIADPTVVSAAQQQDDPAYGEVTLTRLVCYDEPELDARSWTGWNMWTVGWNSDEPRWTTYTLDGTVQTNCFAYLYDGFSGFSCALNYSASADNDDNKSGITGFASDLAEPDKALPESNEYAKSYPYVQGPTMTNGIGYVQFRARRDNAGQKTPSVVTVFGLTDPERPETAEEVTNITVTADAYRLYTWRSTVDNSAYKAMRLAVKGASGTGGRDEPSEAYYMDGSPIQRLQRVWIDDVAFSEPIAPRLSLLNARPFRAGLTDKNVVSNILDVSQQPLTGESFGFQVELHPQQLADDIDFDSIRVCLAYYADTVPWGWQKWTNRSDAVWSELTRIGTTLVWRSMSDNMSSVVSGQKTPGQVVQYFLQARYRDKSGLWHSHEIDSDDWAGGPTWYWPKDYNADYGGGTREGFSPYTILDSISPKRAWINEVEYFNTLNDSETRQFIEVAVPSGADLTGWYLRLAERTYQSKGVLAAFGARGGDDQLIASKTVRNPYNHYSFMTLASPDTKTGGAYPAASFDGVWNATVRVPYGKTDVSVVSGGVLQPTEPYALELVRPSGVIEHQITVEGTNIYASIPRLKKYGSGAYLAEEMQAADKAGNIWFFAGADAGPGTLGVWTNQGETASCWTNPMSATPALVNEGQYISPDWFLPPSDDFVWIYASILGDYMHVVSEGQTNESAVVMVGRGSDTNLLFTVDRWHEIASMTVDGKGVPDALGKSGSYTLRITDVSNTVDVVASACVGAAVTNTASHGVAASDPYYPAIVNWLMKYDEKDLCFARFMALSGAVVDTLSLKDMYWLDIPPTEPGWILRAGMGGSLVDPSLAASQPCSPVVFTDPKTSEVHTNVRVTVFMQITNDVTGAWHRPDHLLGPGGESSYGYTGQPNWTGETFQIRGALQNGIANDRKVSLRWFVFGPDSFDDNCSAIIELTDPFSIASPAYYERWSDYSGMPVFYSWRLDDDPTVYATEMMKKSMIEEHE